MRTPVDLDNMFGDVSDDDMSDDDILAFMDSVFDGDDLFVPDKDVSFTPDDPDAVPSFYAQPAVEEALTEEGSVVEETAVEPLWKKRSISP